MLLFKFTDNGIYICLCPSVTQVYSSVYLCFSTLVLVLTLLFNLYVLVVYIERICCRLMTFELMLKGLNVYNRGVTILFTLAVLFKHFSFNCLSYVN